MDLKSLVARYQNASNAIYRSLNVILKEKVHSDITTDQFSTLNQILKQEQCTSTDIASAFGIGKSAVTAQINRLHAKGLIKRKRDEADRRVIYLSVTDKGKEFVEYTQDKVYSYIGEHLSHFEEEEIIEFMRSLEKLANLMENNKEVDGQ
ncbi:MarR family winged helix-turn-helix transcriptional regulator [Oceanobacillus massiliensis]|uniref:MarR family winged helix-turn-helix transcriptional regulator n=1 Tax=Oceanobacillus massiliensis TaxID=1465765 RepID=UPI00028858C1|nr:MarR family transcriptional regulator [Oceanobacillus massiliensis]